MFGECPERRMVAIGPFFVKLCAFEVTKIGNFAKLRIFGFFFINFLTIWAKNGFFQKCIYFDHDLTTSKGVP